MNEKFNEHLNRIKMAIALEKPDRTPVVLQADAYCARQMGVKLSEFIMDPALANKTIVDYMQTLGDIDGLEMFVMYGPLLSVIWNSKVRLPGRELPENSLWQLEETELMTAADYDTILDKGWNAFLQDYYRERLDNLGESLGVMIDAFPQAMQYTAAAGLVPYTPVNTTLPIDALSGGRSIVKFVLDVHKMPDKVQAVMEVIVGDMAEALRGQIRMLNPLAVFVGSGRGAGEFWSPKIWERIVWPHLKKLVEVVIEEGAVPHLHLDSCWDRDIKYFRELPKGKCVFGTDSATDIFKLKEVLDGHMCIMGDVPPTLLTLGTPDEVYSYTAKLLKEIGPAGYILGQGCTIPPDAKPENVQAMVAAALD